MIETKIQLSAAEMQLMCNADVILTKNVVIQKTIKLLEGVQHSMQALVEKDAAWAVHPVFETPPKISKGENYNGLPYLILDYPRVFKGGDVFAVRTFFWWGRFFSSTLQLAGSYKQNFLPRLANAYSMLAPAHFIGINTDPWQHHFERDNYVPVAALTPESFKNRLLESTHIKIAAQYPLLQWHEAATALLHNWKLYINICLA